VFALPIDQLSCAQDAALLEGRRGGGVESRRKLKDLAPLLFERLRDGGRL
jgi:hypothetical protein